MKTLSLTRINLLCGGSSVVSELKPTLQPTLSRVLKTPLVCEEHEKQVFLRLTIARLRSFNADQRRSLGPFGLWSRRRCHGNYTGIRANTSRSSNSSERVNHIAFLCVIIKRKARREISNKVKDMIEHGEINYCDVVFENQLRC
ncbi:hypothetical protein TNCV_3549011 [Trichonephila clavipes]|nr:hypothetical protein TNCV_3549011 [Trichonephila clavipes]